MSANIFIYAEPDDGNGNEIFQDISGILEKIIDSKKYQLKRFTRDEATDETNYDCKCLFIHNRGGEEKFDEHIRRSMAKYFLDYSGKLVFLCNPDEGRRSVWFLKALAEYGKTKSASGSGSEEWPDAVGLAFEKLSHNQSIPANLQALRIDRGDRYTDFSLGLVRGDSEIAFMYLMSDDGGSVVFLSGTPQKLHENKSGPMWRDVMRVLRVVGVEALPPHSPEVMQCRLDAPCFGDSHVLVYAGLDDQSSVYESIAAVVCPLIGNKFKVLQLKHQDIINPISPSPWWANCVALFVQNDSGHTKFDESLQRELTKYFLGSGKLIFFCNPNDGHRSTWLLNSLTSTIDSSDSGVHAKWSMDVGRAFEKFLKNEPLPSNLQCVQVQKGETETEFFLGLVRASDGNTPYMYLRCDDGDTAVFVGAKVEDAIELNVPVWLDLLRLIGLKTID